MTSWIEPSSDESSDAPICRSCGVTALPAEGFGAGFICENPDCEVEGEPVE